MIPDMNHELAEFRREVKAVLDTALSETDAPLAVGDLRRGSSPPFSTKDPKSRSCRVCTAGVGRDEMGEVDRELAMLEQSNAALFTALAQTRAVPARPLPTVHSARMRSMGAREEARVQARLREAAEIQERERRRRLEKRELVARTRDLKRTVSELEREKSELTQRLEEKRQRRARREADARQRDERRRREEEAKALRKQMGSTVREADRLRVKLEQRAEQTARARAREALWRWRAGAAASVAARERRERLAAEKAVASTATAAAARDFAREAARERDYEARHYSLGRGGDDARRYRREADRNVGAIRSPRTEYQRTYGGGRSRRTRSEIEWEGGARQRDYAHQGYEGGAVGSDSPRAEYQRTYDGGGRDRTAGSNVERGDHGNHRDYAAQRYEGDADHATRATEPLTAGYQLRCGGSDRARTTETAFDRHGRKAYAVQNEVPRYGRNSQRSGGAAKPSTDEYQDTRGADSDHPSRAAMERAERGNRVAVGAVSTASGSPRATHSAVEQGRWEGLVRRGSSEAVETAAITVVRQHAERAVAVAVASAEDHRRESRDLQERLSRTTEERGVLERKLAGKEGDAADRRQTSAEEPRALRSDRRSTRVYRTSKAERAETLVQSLALILRPAIRAREGRQVEGAFRKLWEAWVVTRVGRKRTASRAAQEAQDAREAVANAASMSAGIAVTAAVLGRARRRAAETAFRLWRRTSEEARRKRYAREAVLRQVVFKADRRSRDAKAKALQRWRLASATAAMEDLRWQQRTKSLERAAVLTETMLNRRDGERVLTGFQRWRVADAEILRARVAATAVRDRRSTAARAIVALFYRCRRRRLQHAFKSLRASARAAGEREQRAQRARLLAARGKRAARVLLLTKCLGTWKAFATAKSSARRLAAAGEQTRRMEAERRHLRVAQLVLTCKAAMTAADARRKARAWHVWRRAQGLAAHEHAARERVLRTAAQCLRVGRLRRGLRRWREECEASRAGRSLLPSRAVRLRSVAVLPGVARTPQMDAVSAFRTSAQATEARKITSLRRSQAARILFGMLRSSRRDMLTRGMDTWRSAAARRVRDGKLFQGLVLRTAHRQRMFFLGKAWSKIVWAAGEREAARARKLGAVRTVHSLLASAARASRRRAWAQWKQVVVGAAGAKRLHGARRAALQRCVRARALRNMRAAWDALQSRVRQSRALVTGATRLQGTLFRARRRALSRRLGVWRSESLAGAIAAGQKQAVRDRRRAAVRLLASTAGRVRRRRLESGWRALATFAAESRREEAEHASRSERAGLLVQRTLERARKRELSKVWKAWVELLTQRRMQGEVGAAVSSLEEEKASLAREVAMLKRAGAIRLIVSAAERSNRVLLKTGWHALRQATHRRATLLRAVGIFSRSRLRTLRLALHHWRVEASEIRRVQLRAHAGRAALAACLAGARGRVMRPAWKNWRELVWREQGEEDEFAGREEGLLAFAAVLTRVGKRRDRARKHRALGVWRIGVARAAVSAAQQQAALRAGVAAVENGKKADLLAVQVDCHNAGARLALRWLSRLEMGRQLAAWRQWTLATLEDRAAEEREMWRVRAAAQLVRELARVSERRRHRIIRRSLHLWHHHAESQIARALSMGQDASSRQAGARRLGAVLERNLLRRKSRVWARLVGSAVAASGRAQRDREAQAQRARLVAVAESRSSRRLLSAAWLAWKETWAAGRHRSEVQSLQAARGAAAVAGVVRRKEGEAQRQALAIWRAQALQARQKERAMSRAVSCLRRSEVRVARNRMARCLAQWRLMCAMSGRALADENRASAQAAFRGQTVLALLRRKRMHRLGEGFRRLVHHRAIAVYGIKEEQARRDNVSRALRSLKRMVVRRSQRRVMSAFVRWRCFAAEIGQQSDRALLLSAQRRAGAQATVSILSRHETCVISRAWTLWRAGAASAAVHDGERASADLRVSGARHSAGARLLATTLSSARRRVLWKAWNAWCTEAKEAADAEVKTMEKHFHLARTLTRVEKRNQLARVGRAWRGWNRYVRVATSLPRVAERVRQDRLAHGMTQWRLACLHQRKAKAEEGRAAAEATVRTQALSVLVKRCTARQVSDAFYRLVEHGAWAIYWSKEEDARLDRLSKGFHTLARARARRTERRKLAALARWRYFASESRRQHDRFLLQAAGQRAGTKALASLVSHRENSSVARAWAIWRSGATTAAVHEGERASADLRVVAARRSAGARLFVGVLGSTRRRALGKAWSVWCQEAKATARAESQTMKKHLHLARTLTRVERRAQLAKVGRSWRAWREVVRVEGEIEVQALERHFHVAQTVIRVAHRAQKRRLVRAWGLWTRLAARGQLRQSSSVTSFPAGLLAAARTSHAPSLMRARTEYATGDGAAAGAAAPVGTKQQEEQVKRSRGVSHRGGAVAVRRILRRAETRCLTHSWQAWRAATVADATRQARMILGATRLVQLLAEAEENHDAQAVHHCWGRWVKWSTAEGSRLEQVDEAVSWAAAEAEADKRKMQATAAGVALAAVMGRWENRVLRSCMATWLRAASGVDVGGGGVSGRVSARRSPQRTDESAASVVVAAITTESPRTRRDVARGGKGLGGKTTSTASPSSALTALRRKLLGDASPGLPKLPAAASVEARRSPGAAVSRASRRFMIGTSSPLRQAVEAGVKSPSYSPSPPQRHHGVDKEGEPTTPGHQQAWWGEFSDYSSSPFSPALPPNYSGGKSTNSSYLASRTQPEEGETPTGVGKRDDEHGSFDLSVSPESVKNVLGSHSAGGAGVGAGASPPLFGPVVVAAPGAAAVDSPAGSSLAYMSDSPLRGESMLQSRSSANMSGGSGDRSVSVDRGLAREWALAEENDAVQSPSFSVHDVHKAGEGEGEGGGSSFNIVTGNGIGMRSPEDPRLRWSSVSLNGGGGGGGGSERSKTNAARFAKSPPYVGGSVHSLVGSSHGSPPWSGEAEREEKQGPVKELFAYIGPEEEEEEAVVMEGMEFGGERLELLSGGEGNGGKMADAEAFVARIRVVLWRRAFKRWVRVDRDAVYSRRMMDTTRKVAFLRRQQKLRKVVVSALRRQSYAWHVNDASRAMRKWKDLVRRNREDDRLSLELSRISAVSPMTPLDARAHASALGSDSTSARGTLSGSRGYGRGEGGGGDGMTPLFYRSPFSPSTSNTGKSSLSTRRRLWSDQD